MSEPKSADRQRIVLRSLERRRVSDSQPSAASSDEVAVEEPLEIRLTGDTFATIMRTPGDDHFLTAGFLYSEGIIQSLADLGKIAHCGRPTDAGYGNLVDVAPGPGTVLAPERVTERRGTIVSSACGVCGRERIDDLIGRLGRVPNTGTISSEAVASSVERLAHAQRSFARTGAMHGALALSADGEELATGEDVGRHNAVDKVIGKLLFAELLTADRAVAQVLAVSGRTSFEIIQKAAAARIAVVVSVSAPTSLAIDTADALGVTLAGFARGDAFNLYTHPERVRPA
jgi:FdhD protein